MGNAGVYVGLAEKTVVGVSEAISKILDSVNADAVKIRALETLTNMTSVRDNHFDITDCEFTVNPDPLDRNTHDDVPKEGV